MPPSFRDQRWLLQIGDEHPEYVVCVSDFVAPNPNPPPPLTETRPVERAMTLIVVSHHESLV
jgi:hypothetical protein